MPFLPGTASLPGSGALLDTGAGLFPTTTSDEILLSELLLLFRRRHDFLTAVSSSPVSARCSRRCMNAAPVLVARRGEGGLDMGGGVRDGEGRDFPVSGRGMEWRFGS